VFGKQIKLFKLFGFQVGIDWSWLIIAVLIAWSLSTGYFPYLYKDLPTSTYWKMGILGAVGLFLSIIFHEMCHSLVARKYGLPMKGITLFIFGGVAQMDREPPSPKAEFMMALAGPLSSFLIALFFYGFYIMGKGSGWSPPVYGVVGYLAMINGLLGAFNLLPAFPLDGGRVLRSILWKVKKNLRWATRISSYVGSAFGILFIVLGVISFLRGSVIGGVWWFLIGLFLRNAASVSYQQILIRRALEGEKVQQFMTSQPVTVGPSTSISELVDNYVYKYHFKFFPVVDSNRLVGCVSTRQIKDIPKEEWKGRKVGEMAQTCSKGNTIGPGADAMEALSTMSRNKISRLMVVEGSRLLGVISLKDMLSFISHKVELETE
jgi:Zn-dependent protease/CBS domain-containing protein